MRLDNRGNLTLIGLLVALVIIGILAAVMFGGSPSSVGKDSELLDGGSTKKSVPGRAIDKGKSVACLQQLNQIRAGIQMHKATSMDESNPPTLKDAVPNVSTAYFQCPVSNQLYTYDPATGKVGCPTHPDF